MFGTCCICFIFSLLLTLLFLILIFFCLCFQFSLIARHEDEINKNISIFSSMSALWTATKKRTGSSTFSRLLKCIEYEIRSASHRHLYFFFIKFCCHHIIQSYFFSILDGTLVNKGHAFHTHTNTHTHTHTQRMHKQIVANVSPNI